MEWGAYLEAGPSVQYLSLFKHCQNSAVEVAHFAIEERQVGGKEFFRQDWQSIFFGNVDKVEVSYGVDILTWRGTKRPDR